MPAARPPMYLDQGPADDRGPAPQQGLEALLYASQGTPGYGRQILYTDYSHASNYALVVRNQGAGGLALQVQGSDGTDRLLVNNSGVTVTGNIATGTLTTTGVAAVENLAVAAEISFFGVALAEQADAWTQTYTDIQRVIGPLVSTTPAAFSGISSGLGGSPYASVTNLNDLRSEFGLIRADLHDVKKNLNSLINDLRDYGLEPV